MKAKWIMTADGTQRIIRLARVVWTNGTVGDGSGGYSVKLTFALAPRLFRFSRQYDGWFLTIAGIRIHYARSYGGIYA